MITKLQQYSIKHIVKVLSLLYTVKLSNNLDEDQIKKAAKSSLS